MNYPWNSTASRNTIQPLEKYFSSTMFTRFVAKDVPFSRPGSWGLMRHSGAAMLQCLCDRLWDWLILCGWEVGFKQMVALRGVISSHHAGPRAGRWAGTLSDAALICSAFALNFKPFPRVKRFLRSAHQGVIIDSIWVYGLNSQQYVLSIYTLI